PPPRATGAQGSRAGHERGERSCRASAPVNCQDHHSVTAAGEGRTAERHVGSAGAGELAFSKLTGTLRQLLRTQQCSRRPADAVAGRSPQAGTPGPSIARPSAVTRLSSNNGGNGLLVSYYSRTGDCCDIVSTKRAGRRSAPSDEPPDTARRLASRRLTGRV